MQENICKNCGHLFEGNYCSNCGQKAKENRINLHYFLFDVPHSLFNIDGLFFKTLWRMFIKPGVLIEEYLEGKRIKYFKPLSYVMVMSAISTFIVKLLIFLKKIMMQHFDPKFLVSESHQFFQVYFSVFILLMIPIASGVTWLVFLKRKYNFWEHIIANTYIAAQLNFMWIFSHLISVFGILILRHYFEMNITLFFIIFMSFFLYLYGSVFGYLMNHYYKIWQLIALISLMNLTLFYVYDIGFQIAGLI